MTINEYIPVPVDHPDWVPVTDPKWAPGCEVSLGPVRSARPKASCSSPRCPTGSSCG